MDMHEFAQVYIQVARVPRLMQHSIKERRERREKREERREKREEREEREERREKRKERRANPRPLSIVGRCRHGTFRKPWHTWNSNVWKSLQCSIAAKLALTLYLHSVTEPSIEPWNPRAPCGGCRRHFDKIYNSRWLHAWFELFRVGLSAKQ